MKDIFDIKNIKDIPVVLGNQLTSLTMSRKVKEIFSLFKIKDNLIVDEVMVGLFRKYKKLQKRGYVSCVLYNLYRRGLLKKIKPGHYELVKKLEEI